MLTNNARKMCKQREFILFLKESYQTARAEHLKLEKDEFLHEIRNHAIKAWETIMSEVSYSWTKAAEEVFNSYVMDDLLYRQPSAEDLISVQNIAEEEQNVPLSPQVSGISLSGSSAMDENEILSRTNPLLFETQSSIQEEEQQLDTFEKLVYDFICKCIIYRKEEVKDEITKILDQLGESDLETTCAKQNHSLTADENFVYITGGTLPGDEKRFEIFILKLNCIIKGPRMSVHRNSHCSFIQDDYLYVFGGEVLSGSSTTMTFERLRIFSHVKDTLKIKSDYSKQVPKALKYLDSLVSFYEGK